MLVLDLGQVGDVVMSFPALIALRKHFPLTDMVAVAGKTPAALLGDLGLVDRVISIDRYGLLRGRKLASISKILDLVRQIRRQEFDLVVDLHSLYETNLLGYFSGARHRLFADRRNRSLNFLSNVRPNPPLYDPSKHLAEIYLDVLGPLDISGANVDIQVAPPADLSEKFSAEYIKPGSETRKLVGMLIGAGNASRKWPLKNFVELAKRFDVSGNQQLFVFTGPEEKQDETSIREQFDGLAVVVPDLSLIELAAAFSTMHMVIGNDTGTTHLAAVSGPRVIMISDKRAPNTFAPLGSRSKVVKPNVIQEITVDDVWEAVDLPE